MGTLLFAGYSFFLGMFLGVVLSKPWKCLCPYCASPKLRGCPDCGCPVLDGTGACVACGKRNGRTEREDTEIREYVLRSWGDRDETANLRVDITCVKCGCEFFGHKRRLKCKSCDEGA